VSALLWFDFQRAGSNTVTLPGKPLFVRLFLKNSEGQFWSMDTLKVPAE
jgi:hypothetical protein